MQIKQDLLHALRQVFKNEFSQTEIKFSIAFGNNNRIFNDKETGISFLNLQEALVLLGKEFFSKMYLCLCSSFTPVSSYGKRSNSSHGADLIPVRGLMRSQMELLQCPCQ